jgi:Ca2+-binding RTX toxin-like protein
LDFEVGTDLIVLSALDFELEKGRLLKGRFTIGAAVSDHRNGQPHLIYNDQTGNLLFDADGAHAGAPSLLGVLNPGLDLAASSFQVV